MIQHATLPTVQFARVYKPKRTRLTDPAEDAILTTLAARKREPMVLEIGTYLGHTTANLARVVKPLGGFVLSVDVKSRPPSLPEVQRGEVLPESMIGSAIPKELRSAVKLLLVDGEVGLTRDDVAKYIGNQVDLVFIDGNHSYEGVQGDALATIGCLSVGGVILFHDVWWDVTPPPVDGPLRLMEESGNTCVVNFTHIGMFVEQLENAGGKLC